jgi:hypothetical protein
MATKAFAAILFLSLLSIAGCGEGKESPASSPSAERRTGGEQSIERFGKEASAAERQEILTAYRSYLGAIGRRDYPSACTFLAEPVKRSLAQIASTKKASCEEVLGAILAPTAAALARAQAKGEVTRVRVKDENGFVVFKAAGARLYQLTMVSAGGEWKAGSVGAAVLVPDL